MQRDNVDDALAHIPAQDEIIRLYRPTAVGSSTIVSSAVQRISDMILRGQLVAGQRLIEADICRATGIARAPVREALRILAGDGMVELIPDRGARVAVLDPEGLESVLDALGVVIVAGVKRFGLRHGRPSKAIASAVESAYQRLADAEKIGSLALLQRATEYHVLINYFSGNIYLNRFISRLGMGLYEKILSEMMSPRMLVDAPPSYRELTGLINVGSCDEAASFLERAVVKLTDDLRRQAAPLQLARRRFSGR